MVNAPVNGYELIDKKEQNTQKVLDQQPEKQCEQKSTGWSEKDEEHIESILKRLDGMCKKGATFTKTHFAVDQDMDWLKSLKGRVQPQPKQGRSEEDEKKIRALLSICDVYSTKFSFYPKENKDIENLKNWLKSIRPQNTWKPSNEQMELLREVQQALLGKDCHNRFVDFMYELKRLREE